MQEMFFESHILSPELELQALEGFPSWFKQEYGIDLSNENEKRSLAPSLAVYEASRAVQRAKTQSNSTYPDVIQKIASILVDMVIDEEKSLKRYD